MTTYAIYKLLTITAANQRPLSRIIRPAIMEHPMAGKVETRRI